MKVRSIVFVLAFSLLTQVAFAQTYAFKVLVSKGKNEYKSETGWQNIKVGSSLKPTDEVKIGDNAYLGLIHSTGKPLEVRESKTYKVSDLVTKMAPGTSVLNKYTDFILSSQTEKQNRLSATGAVHRDLPGTESIVLFVPKKDQAKLYGDQMVIQWSSAKTKGPYVVSLMNLMEEEIMKIETAENFVSIPVNTEKLKKESQIIVKVSTKGKKPFNSASHTIKRLKPAERLKMDSVVTAAELPTEKTALTRYVQAGFYEENLLLLDALTAYQEATKLAPDVELYRVAYEDYLKRMGFIK